MASQGNGNDGIGIPKQTGYAQMTFEFGFEGEHTYKRLWK